MCLLSFTPLPAFFPLFSFEVSSPPSPSCVPASFQLSPFFWPSCLCRARGSVRVASTRLSLCVFVLCASAALFALSRSRSFHLVSAFPEGHEAHRLPYRLHTRTRAPSQRGGGRERDV